MLLVEVARPAFSVSTPDGHRPKVRSPHDFGSPIRSGIPDALLVAATSVLLVAIAYARAREQMRGSPPRCSGSGRYFSSVSSLFGL